MKKIIALLLVLALAVSCFVGCVKAPVDDTKDTKPADTKDTTPVETTAPVSTDPFDGTHDIVEVTWCINSNPQDDGEAVLAEVNKMLEEKYNLHLNLEFIPGGEYNDKMLLKITGKEDWDLCFTANWSNNFYSNVDMGAFLPLNDLLAGEIGQELMAVYPQGLTGVTTIGGNIYGLPNYQIICSKNALFIQKDLMDKYGLKLKTGDAVDGGVAVDAVWDFMEKVRDNEEDMFVLRHTGAFEGALESSADKKSTVLGSVAAIDYDDNNFKVYFRQDSDAWLKQKKGLNNLYKEGFVREDAATVTDDTADYQANRYAMYVTTGKPGGEINATNSMGEAYEMIYIGADQAGTLSSTAGISSVTAINYNSKNPEAALKMYSIMWNDPEVFNTLLFGIEGEHYNKVGENRVEQIADSGYNMSGYAWMLGSQFNAWLLPGQADDIWELTDKMNRDATVCNLAGFVFDSEPVSAEIAAVNAVVAEYDAQFLYADDVEALADEYVEKLEAAGAEAICKEAQKQIDEWRVANGK